MPKFAVILTIIASLYCLPANAEETLLDKQAFLNKAFPEDLPIEKKLWITKADHEEIEKIVGTKYDFFRVGYWQKDHKTAFILEDIGKYKPITVGFIINDSKIENVEVLIYRESHGWEIKYPFFTSQFSQVTLEGDKLSKEISNISGATLSVDALKRMAKLALHLESMINNSL